MNNSRRGAEVKAGGTVSRLLFFLPSHRMVVGVEIKRNKQVQEIVTEEITIKISASFLLVINELILKFIRKYKKSRMAKGIFKKKKKVEGQYLGTSLTIKVQQVIQCYTGIRINVLL